MKNKLIIGTRRSELALWQANNVAGLLKEKFPSLEIILKKVVTKGDKILDKPLEAIGGKGLFTKELESELLAGTIDIAVHSLKDMPTELPAGLSILAVPERGAVADVLVSRRKEYNLNTLPIHATVATGSLRRKSQLLWWRPDFNIPDLRGNVNTRIQKFLDSDWDGVVLAKAGLERLGLTDRITHEFSLKELLPAAGQGALAIEGRSNDKDVAQIVAAINHSETELCTLAERSFLQALGGGCKTPIAVYASIENAKMFIQGLVGSADGKKLLRKHLTGDAALAKHLGELLAEKLINQGAKDLLIL
jgi:hydroxymethylbilane synthase